MATAGQLAPVAHRPSASLGASGRIPCGGGRRDASNRRLLVYRTEPVHGLAEEGAGVVIAVLGMPPQPPIAQVPLGDIALGYGVLCIVAIALGKWLGCWTILVLYAALLCGGVLLVARLVGDYTPPNAARGLPLLLLEGTVLLSLALAGGTRLSTLANGVTVIGLYGLAFVGGWMEQIGTLASNATARYIGIAASLLVPSESLWQLASHHMQPPLGRDLGIQSGGDHVRHCPFSLTLNWKTDAIVARLGWLSMGSGTDQGVSIKPQTIDKGRFEMYSINCPWSIDGRGFACRA